MIIVPANTLAAGGFSVDNSCRFNDGDSSKMLKAMGTATNNLKFTFNCWFKRGIIGTNQVFAHARDGTSGPYFNMMIGSDDKLRAYGPDKDGGNDFDYKTNRVLRDVGAWYCVTIAMDTSLGAAGDRLRIYINGVEETSFTTETNPAQNIIYVGNYTGYDFGIGANLDNSAYFDGYIAECVHIDGQQLTPTSFGEFDDDSPDIWKPIDVSGLTFGNNGFYLDFEASDNLGNDANGGTDLTETNLAAADQATDTPTNNFCTLNPLDNFFQGHTFSEGNLKMVTQANNTYTFSSGTFGLSSGKWYAECKLAASGGYADIGIANKVSSAKTDSLGGTANGGYAKHDFSSNVTALGSGVANGAALSVGNVCGVFLDLDNSKLYFSINGSLQNTTGIGITAAASTTNGNYFFCGGDEDGGSAVTLEWNFGGCSSFSLSSAVNDDNGYGNFEYTPTVTVESTETKFYAVCTKNLAEYG